MKPGWRYVLTGVVLVALLVGSIFLVRRFKPSLPSRPADFARARGPLEAPVQIIEYSDFQCPACGQAQPILEALLKEYPDKIRLTYQHFPLQAHPWSGLAHQAAECAAQQNHFWPYHDRLYREQAGWSQNSPDKPPLEFFIRYAEEEKLDVSVFSRCLLDLKVTKTIREESLAGEGLGVRSTPTFFVNGEAILGVTKLQEKIKQALK